MADYMTYALILFPFVAWLYWNVNKAYTFWSFRGVPGPKPFFYIGNLHQIFKHNRGPGDLIRSQVFGKMYGFYTGRSPILVVTDAKLIKQILVKDFHYFVNRNKQKVEHDIWIQNLFAAEGERWRRIRTITSPAFTSGKLKAMHSLMEKCISKFAKYLDSVVEKEDGIIKDTKETLAGFTIDVIASTSFATETNSNEESRTTKSPFVDNGQRLFWVNPFRAIPILLLPKWILDIFKVKTFFNPRAFQWFEDLSREIVRQRRLTGVKRNDFVQLLLDAAVDEKELDKVDFEQLTADVEKDDDSPKQTPTTGNVTRTLTENEIIAQSIIFFAAGFETTSSTLFHTIYELLKNPTIQERLCDEIQRATEDLTDEKSPEYFERVVNEIPYLDATVKEVLRKYPPVTVLFRRVTSDSYTLNGVQLPKDLQVEINAYAVHHSPDYYPEPEKFNPDRFMPENKHLLVPYSYLPFGAGPRNCVGMRFAYQEVKLCLAKIVTRYRFEPTDGTPEKLTFKRASPLLNTQTFPVKISKRN